MISINRPAKDPNHRVLSTGAVERYVFRSRIENSPFLLEYIYDQMHRSLRIAYLLVVHGIPNKNGNRPEDLINVNNTKISLSVKRKRAKYCITDKYSFIYT